jgi:hypothetical protein
MEHPTADQPVSSRAGEHFVRFSVSGHRPTRGSTTDACGQPVCST